jgi:hypothetical protein
MGGGSRHDRATASRGAGARPRILGRQASDGIATKGPTEFSGKFPARRKLSQTFFLALYEISKGSACENLDIENFRISGRRPRTDLFVFSPCILLACLYSAILHRKRESVKN